MSGCERAQLFAGGALDEASASAFRLHLADCQSCQDEVEEALVFSALDDRAGIGALVVAAEPGRLAWWKRRFVWLALPAVAAVALALYIGLRGSPAANDGAALARRFHDSLRESRSVDGRFGYDGADRHRPYDVPLADRADIEKVPAAVLGALESAGHQSALVAAYALMGATELAASTAEALPETASHLSDRAALAIVDDSPRQALLLSSKALALEPTLVVAKWNRAVALTRLELPLAAADAFDSVAAIGEPGWAEEARERAGRLRSSYQAGKAEWEAAVAAIDRFAASGELPSTDMIRAHPEVMRLGLYEAISRAAKPSETARLGDLAARLDEQFGTDVLSTYLERIENQPTARRGSLARRYASVLEARTMAGDPSLARDAVRAGQPDIALSALFYAKLDDEDRALYLRLAAESRDDWLDLLAREHILAEHVNDGFGLNALDEGMLALARCNATRFEYRCLRLEFWVASAFALAEQVESARVHAGAGWARARRTGDWMMELRFVSLLAEISNYDDGVSGSQLPMMRAYLEEAVKRWPECPNATHAAYKIADALITQRSEREGARVLAESDAACPEKEPGLFRLYLDAHLTEGRQERVDAVLHGLEVVRARRTDPAARAYAAHIEGRALLAVDEARGTASLRRALELASNNDGIEAVRAYAYSIALAAVDAGRRNDPSAALDWLAGEQGLAAESCALAIASDTGVVVAARDQAGTAIGVHRDVTPRSLLDSGTVIPPAISAHLAGCPMIDVFARPPFLGQPLLAPSLPWRFRQRPRTSVRGSARRHLIVTDVEAPAGLGLPRLAASPGREADVQLRGARATPERVLSELATATIVELHVHGVVGGDGEGSATLVLSSDDRGRYTLSGADIEAVTLRGAPLVILSACRGALTPGRAVRARSLATSLLSAGATAVIASPDPIPDADAYAFFDAVLRRIDGGENPAEAVRRERVDRAKRGVEWSNRVVVFE